MIFNTMEYLHHFTHYYFVLCYVQINNNSSISVQFSSRFFLFFALKDPGGLTDYIDAEYIPDFLGGPYEVRCLVIRNKCEEMIKINQFILLCSARSKMEDLCPNLCTDHWNLVKGKNPGAVKSIKQLMLAKDHPLR